MLRQHLLFLREPRLHSGSVSTTEKTIMQIVTHALGFALGLLTLALGERAGHAGHHHRDVPRQVVGAVAHLTDPHDQGVVEQTRAVDVLDLRQPLHQLGEAARVTTEAGRDRVGVRGRVVGRLQPVDHVVQRAVALER